MLEVAVAVEDFLGVVGIRAAVEHGQRALAEELVETAVARVEELGDLGLREVLEAAARPDARVDEFRNDDAGFNHGRGLARSGQDLDRRVVGGQQPDLDDVGSW